MWKKDIECVNRFNGAVKISFCSDKSVILPGFNMDYGALYQEHKYGEHAYTYGWFTDNPLKDDPFDTEADPLVSDNNTWITFVVKPAFDPEWGIKIFPGYYLVSVTARSYKCDV